jgi:hypothetical protein
LALLAARAVEARLRDRRRSVTASDDVDLAPVVECVPPSGSFFPRGTTLVTCTATDACGNQSASQFQVTVQIKARRR